MFKDRSKTQIVFGAGADSASDTTEVKMISKQRLLLTEDGKVVEEGNSAGVRLLVGAGGAVPSEHIALVKEYEASRQAPAEEEGAAASEDSEAATQETKPVKVAAKAAAKPQAPARKK